MARAQIVEKLLPEVVGRIDIEDEEIRALINDDMLRLLEAVRDIDMRPGRGLKERGTNRAREVPVRRENQNASALR